MNEITVYPNPTQDVLHIINLLKDEVKVITMKNLLGQEILVTKTAATSVEIDVQQFASGVYLLTVFSEKKTYVARIVKK